MKLSEVAFRPPSLETPRLLLRGWEPSDVDEVFAYASDPEATQYMFWARHQTIADAHSFLDAIVAPNYESGELDYAITERDAPERIIGAIGAYWKPRDHQVMELGYILSRAHWGKGYVPEAGRRLLAHAFSTTPVERIFAPIFSENLKSRRAAEKMGMRREGELRSSMNLRGRRWDQAIYSILRGEHEARAGGYPEAFGQPPGV